MKAASPDDNGTVARAALNGKLGRARCVPGMLRAELPSDSETAATLLWPRHRSPWAAAGEVALAALPAICFFQAVPQALGSRRRQWPPQWSSTGEVGRSR